VSELADRPAYCVLRVCGDADASDWWRAIARRPDAPEAISVLLTGRTRVELSCDEAARALAWAEQVEGWAGADTKPLCVYPQAG
jgi:hypothetical protein